MQKINLYAGRYILIIELSNGETVAIPTSKAVALTFNSNLSMIDDRLERNTARLANGLQELQNFIKYGY